MSAAKRTYRNEPPLRLSLCFQVWFKNRRARRKRQRSGSKVKTTSPSRSAGAEKKFFTSFLWMQLTVHLRHPVQALLPSEVKGQLTNSCLGSLLQLPLEDKTSDNWTLDWLFDLNCSFITNQGAFPKQPIREQTGHFDKLELLNLFRLVNQIWIWINHMETEGSIWCWASNWIHERTSLWLF